MLRAARGELRERVGRGEHVDDRARALRHRLVAAGEEPEAMVGARLTLLLTLVGGVDELAVRHPARRSRG
jgi:hypothetical protein